MITYTVLNQVQKSWGIDIAINFYDSETEKITTKTFRSDNFLTELELSEILNHAIYNIKFDLNPLNGMDLGENFKEFLIVLVKYIRNHPDCSLVQLKTVAETAYPDLLWKTDKLINWIKNQLQNHFKTIITFAKFKTYIINHNFEGID